MNRFHFLILVFSIFCSANLTGQVKIGVDSVPRKGAILDLNSSVKGGLVLSNVYISDENLIPSGNPKIFPGITAANNSHNPEFRGAIVFNTNPNLPEGVGIYVWTGDKWEAVGFARLKNNTP